MNGKALFKIGTILFYLVLAAYSCWATTHSLHLLMPTVPTLLVWGITIAFFIVASFGTKLIVDSLNQNVYQENRKGMLVGGIVLTVLFWLVCSMPTNTHTFFYNQKIGDVITQDINVTQGYLKQLAERQVTDPEFTELEETVGDLQLAMNNEFNGVPGKSSGRKGNGQFVMESMRKINNELGSDIHIDPRNNVYDVQILNRYNSAITRELNKVKRNQYQTQDADKAQLISDDLDVMADTINIMVDAGSIDEDIIKQTEGVLQRAYALIKLNAKYVTFEPNDEEIYTAQNLVTRTKRLLSVFDVWADFVKGRYAGSGFIFWVIISILVDLGAFILFDIAFAKRDDY
jgi:hypothetical protein